MNGTLILLYMNILKSFNNKINGFLVGSVYADTSYSNNSNVYVGWKVPSLADIIGFVIKFLFIIAGLAALIFLLLGALAWVTSSGDKENVKKDKEKIQAAVVGLVVIVAVLAIIVTLEQFVFNGKLCLGISCEINIPSLIENNTP